MRSDCDRPRWWTVSISGAPALNHGVKRPVAPQYAHDLFRDTPLAALLRLARRAADVRREEHVVEPQQRMVVARRLALHDVDGGAGDALLDEAPQQRILVDDAAAREVHEERRLLHEREQALVHQMARFRA